MDAGYGPRRPYSLLLGLNLGEELLLGLGNPCLPGLQGDLLGVPPLLGHVFLRLGLRRGVGTDGLVGLLVHGLDGICGNAVLDVTGKLLLVSLLVLLLKNKHIIELE